MTVPQPTTPIRAAVFDLGGVLVDWDPRHLYRGLFGGDDAAMERFLSEVCTPAWNAEQDRGRPFAEATALLRARHPEQAALIDAFHLRWPEMIAGPIEGTVQILRELRDRGLPLYALTNWSAETFPVAVERFAFLDWFEAVLVSGHEGLIKPDPRIFELLCRRHGLHAPELVFIDDNADNVAAAAALGMRALRFASLERLRVELGELGLL